MNNRRDRAYLQNRRQFRQSREQDAHKPEHWMDVWLPRISHFSQFGLFALTIGALYFTVIPLYQKAVLDEAIAKKEIQLTAAEKELEASRNRIKESEQRLSESLLRLQQSEKALDDSYANIRRYVLNGFAFTAGAECTGLMTKIDVDERLKNPLPEIAPALTQNYSECFKKMFAASKSLHQLRKADHDRFAAEVREAALIIEARRKVSLQLYRDFPAKATQDPSILKPVNGFTAQALKALRPFHTEQQHQAATFKASVKQGQDNIADEFRASIPKQLLDLPLVAQSRSSAKK